MFQTWLILAYNSSPASAQIQRRPAEELPSQAAISRHWPRANDGVEAQELSLWEPRGPFSGSSPGYTGRITGTLGKTAWNRGTI